MFKFYEEMVKDLQQALFGYTFFKEPLYKEPICRRAKKFKELVLLKTKSLRNCSISNMSITASNRELGNLVSINCSQIRMKCAIHVASVSKRGLR